MGIIWHGYSERGLVNAVFEAVGTHPDSVNVLARLLDRCWRLPCRQSDGSVRPGGPHRVWPEGVTYEGAEVFVEHSLSDFGEPDVVVLVRARLASGDVLTKAYFVEAKRESFARSVRLQGKNLKENASSIIHELFLKTRFVDQLNKDPQTLVKTDVNPGVEVYAHDRKRYRHVGAEPMVRSLVDRLQTEPIAHFFIALTATAPPSPREQPDLVDWEDGLHMSRALEEIAEANASSPAADWIEATYHLSWDDVGAWALDEDLERVTRTLEENRTKLKRDP